MGLTRQSCTAHRHVRAQLRGTDSSIARKTGTHVENATDDLRLEAQEAAEEELLLIEQAAKQSVQLAAAARKLGGLLSAQLRCVCLHAKTTLVII